MGDKLSKSLKELCLTRSDSEIAQMFGVSSNKIRKKRLKKGLVRKEDLPSGGRRRFIAGALAAGAGVAAWLNHDERCTFEAAQEDERLRQQYIDSLVSGEEGKRYQKPSYVTKVAYLNAREEKGYPEIRKHAMSTRAVDPEKKRFGSMSWIMATSRSFETRVVRNGYDFKLILLHEYKHAEQNWGMLDDLWWEDVFGRIGTRNEGSITALEELSPLAREFDEPEWASASSDHKRNTIGVYFRRYIQWLIDKKISQEGKEYFAELYFNPILLGIRDERINNHRYDVVKKENWRIMNDRGEEIFFPENVQAYITRLESR